MSGYADGCIYTWPGYQRPEPARLTTFTYPADGARETTSPYLYVLGYGGGTSGATLSDATLIGPEGLIALRVVDNHTADVAGTLPPGGFLVPESPLEHDTPYTAQVTFTSDKGVREVRRWSFTTGTVTEGQTPYAEAEPDRRLARHGHARRAHAQGLGHAVPDDQRRDPGPDHHPRADDRPPRARERAAARLPLPREDAHDDAHEEHAPDHVARERAARHGQGQRLLGGRGPVRGPDADAVALVALSAC